MTTALMRLLAIIVATVAVGAAWFTWLEPSAIARCVGGAAAIQCTAAAAAIWRGCAIDARSRADAEAMKRSARRVELTEARRS